MSSLVSCSVCTGFLPPAATACPHCDTVVEGALVTSSRHLVARVAKTLFTLSAGSTFAVTLMACYGMPPCDPSDDGDGDGFFPSYCYNDGLVDCNDDDATVNPEAEDPVGDDIDQNCDGVDGIAVTDAGPEGDSGVLPGQEQTELDGGPDAG